MADRKKDSCLFPTVKVNLRILYSQTSITNLCVKKKFGRKTVVRGETEVGNARVTLFQSSRTRVVKNTRSAHTSRSDLDKKISVDIKRRRQKWWNGMAPMTISWTWREHELSKSTRSLTRQIDNCISLSKRLYLPKSVKSVSIRSINTPNASADSPAVVSATMYSRDQTFNSSSGITWFFNVQSQAFREGQEEGKQDILSVNSVRWSCFLQWETLYAIAIWVYCESWDKQS